MMQPLILGLLLRGPLSLYDVHKHFTGSISLFYAASFGSIQRALTKAVDQGQAVVTETDSNRRRKLYALTDLGREDWRRWMASPPTGSDTESTMLARVYLLGHLPAAERVECLGALRTKLSFDKEGLQELAMTLDAAETPEAAREVYRYQRATLDYGIRSHALALSWLDALEGS